MAHHVSIHSCRGWTPDPLIHAWFLLVGMPVTSTAMSTAVYLEGLGCYILLYIPPFFHHKVDIFWSDVHFMMKKGGNIQLIWVGWATY